MKKFFGLVLVMAVFCVLVSCTSDSNTSSTGATEVGPESNGGKVATKEYAVGDTGPAGGVIFYDDEADETDDIPGVRYLEAAPADTSWEEIQWGEKGIDIPGADKTAVGTGAQNTEDLIRHQGADSEYAAALCTALSVKKYNDWYMPSKDELQLMYEVLSSDDIEGMRFVNYWSSSEMSDYNAWINIFNQGLEANYNKELKFSVRAVRAF